MPAPPPFAPLPFDLVGFDLDGTLLDTSGDLANALNHVLVPAGRGPLALDQVRTMVGRGAKVMLRRALEATGGAPEPMVDALFPALLACYGEHIAEETRAYPGLVEALEGLAARGVRLAVCTNKLEHLARLVLERTGLARYFAVIVGGDTVGVLKPDPAPLLAMIDRAGGGRALFVGDSDNDIDAARAAGVASVAVTFGYVPGDPHALGADAVIDHFDQLVPLVESWPGR